MTANQVFIIASSLMVIGTIYLHLAGIRWGLRWAHLGEISWTKAFGLFVLFIVATCIVEGLIAVACALVFRAEPAVIDSMCFAVAIQFVVISLLISRLYGAGLLLAAKAALLYFAASIAALLLVVLVTRPLIYESFIIPSNGMAPTLLGEHLQLTCPNCGSPAYGSPPDPRKLFVSDEIKTICSKERRTVFVKNDSSPALPGDRISVCKMIAPRRWDIIVFRVPSDPSICYASRLVGLPNEELAIHDGAVWINGEKQIPPESIRSTLYSPTVSLNGQESTGAGSSAVTLGCDETFVLGDFPDNAFDSRFWKEGAPGHPSYAIPKANIVGVVINVYWPPSRWTAFR